MSGSLDAMFQSVIWTVCYVSVLVGLSAYGIHRYCIIYLFLKNRKRPAQPVSAFKELPAVTVQLPVFNEFYVIRRLIESVRQLDYPKNLLQIQILDDSTDETCQIAEAETAKLLEEGFDVEYLHRDNREGFKAGALAAGMEKAKGEYIFILDADFVPAPDVLKKCIDFFTDEKVGMVQMRWGHLNRNYSLLTKVQAMFLDGHLLLEQTARSRSGRFFNFNGTAGIWRKSCIEDADGWHYDTLTEDLDLSYRAQMRGWKFVYLPDVIVPAELPVDMNGFKSQQHRWTKGSIQTCKKLLPEVWKAKLPLLIKLEATAHLTSNFGYLLLVMLCVLILPQSFAAKHGAMYSLLVDLPIFFATSVSIALFYLVGQMHQNPRGWWRDIWLMPFTLALATGMSVNNARGVIEAVLNRQSEFTRTPKYGIEMKPVNVRRVRYMPIKSLLPFIELLFALYFGYCVWNSAALGQWISVPFLLMFFGGFTYVAWKSVSFWLQQAGFGFMTRSNA
ncbi:glycosyltransferase [Terrimicrobium sacchariphilum]|uniref:Glycosyltransferase n=1 Tax=Terrimicrobium sacchariphilum TaxID=690879 RepID=A0A146G6G3_TERSA|nr:cellulose synthase family protein [Terrimicrobium sacchariphilum]GAT32963.1 glycosyltransferase [Terrimicrobium sacchariphilum]